MIAKELEINLHDAFVEARRKRQQLISVEHLLLSLLKPGSGVASALASRAVDVDVLRNELLQYIDAHTPAAGSRHVDAQTYDEVDTQPTMGFQRVIQRAILKVQSSRKPEVGSADVLIAILGEKNSQAVALLAKHGVHEFDTRYYESHGVVPPSQGAADEIGDVGDAAEVQVVLFNDDFTPMEFVVKTLEQFFGMDRDEATEVMLEVHRRGRAVCGLYARETAESIVREVVADARRKGHPLRCQMVLPK